MGKGKKTSRGGTHKGKVATEKRRKKTNWVLPVVVGALVVVGIYLLATSRGEKDVTADNTGTTAGVAKASSGPYKFRETRPTLSTALFVGEVAEAYQIAKDIPEVLDQLYCYCRCAENFGHKSLLSCYADRHAST